MIMPRQSVFNLWHRCAGAWALAFLLIAMLAWLIEGKTGQQYLNWQLLLAVWLVVPVVLWPVGRVFGECERAITYAFFFGLLGCLPFVVALIMGAALVFLLASPEALPDGLVIGIALVSVVCAIAKSAMSCRSIWTSNLIEREFNITATEIVVRHNIELAPEPGKWWKRVESKLFALSGALIPGLAFFTYPFQVGLTHAFGELAVPFLISCLALPWAVHASSQYLTGIYLWIFCCLRLERQHKKPIRFRAR